jgi:hypothetical protein
MKDGSRKAKISQSYLQVSQWVQFNAIVARYQWEQSVSKSLKHIREVTRSGVEVPTILADSSRQFLAVEQVLHERYRELLVRLENADWKIAAGPCGVALVSNTSTTWPQWPLVFEYSRTSSRNCTKVRVTNGAERSVQSSGEGMIDDGLKKYLADLISCLLLPEDFVLKSKNSADQLRWAAPHVCCTPVELAQKNNGLVLATRKAFVFEEISTELCRRFSLRFPFSDGVGVIGFNASTIGSLESLRNVDVLQRKLPTGLRLTYLMAEHFLA